jgi:lipopolysaccharide transport system permease protein
MEAGKSKQIVALAWTLAKQDLLQRHSRSFIGIGWVVLTPLSLILTYTVVFGVLLGVRWGDKGADLVSGYALPLVSGLAGYLFLSELAITSATLFQAKRNYVKKSTFPLIAIWLSNFLRSAIGYLLLLAICLGMALYAGRLTPGAIACFIIVAVPIAIFSAGTSLFFSILGPFLPDTSETLRIVFRVLIYAAPCMYPMSLIAPAHQWAYWLNPITYMAEFPRQALTAGALPQLWQYAVFLALAVAVSGIAIHIFRKASGAVADVL